MIWDIFQDIEFILEIPVLTLVLTLNSSGLKEYMLNAEISKVVYLLGEPSSVTCKRIPHYLLSINGFYICTFTWKRFLRMSGL